MPNDPLSCRTAAGRARPVRIAEKRQRRGGGSFTGSPGTLRAEPAPAVRERSSSEGPWYPRQSSGADSLAAGAMRRRPLNSPTRLQGSLLLGIQIPPIYHRPRPSYLVARRLVERCRGSPRR
jgi:hypothetical protein